MTFLWINWSIDAIALLAAIYYFIRALPVARTRDATFFIGWLVLILGPYASISISYWLNGYGYHLLAVLIAAIPAIPAVLYTGLIVLLAYSESNRSGLRVV